MPRGVYVRASEMKTGKYERSRQIYKNICLNCGLITERKYKTKFCSFSCSNLWIWRNTNRKIKPCLPERIRICLECGKSEVVKGTNHTKFCSRKCSNMYSGRNRRVPHSEEWNGKVSKGRLEFFKNGGKTWNEGKKGLQVAWNKNLTKDTDKRVLAHSASLKESSKKGWNTVESKKQSFVKKYGLDEGTRRFNCWYTKLTKGGHKHGNGGYHFSLISQKLFWELYEECNLKDCRVYFGELNHEYNCGTKENFDFVLLDKKKAIEFNGSKFHANPDIYGPDEKPSPFSELTSKEIWNKDRVKINSTLENGFEVLIIWDKDYKENKVDVLKKCKEFLTNETRTM